MAIYHLSVKPISRSAGRSATAAAAYRSGTEIVDERTGEIHDYTRKGGVVSTDIVLPDGAPEWAADRSKLWNSAELAERRKDACVAREYEVALPAELTEEERRRLAVDFAREMASREGCAVDVCIHEPGRGGDSRNHHAHIMRTTRRIEADGLGAKLDTEKAGRDRKADLEQVRARWAELCNERLHEAGHDTSVDHRTLEAQGIDRMPTTHLGPSATGYERRTDEPSRLRVEWLAQQAACDKIREAADLAGKAVAGLEAELARLVAEKQEQQRQRPPAGPHDDLTAQQLRERVERERQAMELELRSVERHPDVLARLDESRKAGQERDRQQQSMEELGRAGREWREAHPVQNWLHDRKLRPSAYLASLDDTWKKAKAQRDAAANSAAETRQAAVEVMRQREREIEQAQIPDKMRVAGMELLAERKAIEERAEAQRRQALEQVPRAFRDLAARREGRALEWRDGGSQWEAMPPGLRKLVDGYLAVEKGRQREIVLERIMDKGRDQVGDLIEQQRQTYRAQDRGLSR